MLLCVCAFSTVIAANPEREERLKKEAIIFAFSPISWTLGQNDRNWLPADMMICTGTNCVYTVPACDPLYVTSQIKDRTWVLPGDERVRKMFNAREHFMGITVPAGSPTTLNVSVSGGWSTTEGFERNWSLSRDECLVKIKKPAAEPAPDKPAEPAEKPPAR